MTDTHTLALLLAFAGIGQIFIALVYDWVRVILGWEADIGRMEHVWNRQIARAYSRYIQGLNLSFGLITLFARAAFLEGNAVATALAALLAAYWGGRLILAVAVYDTRAVAGRRRLYRVGAWGFNALFAYLAAVYAWVAAFNLA